MAGIEVKDLSKDKESKGSHKKLLIIILVVVLIAAGAGGYFAYKKYHKTKIPNGDFSGANSLSKYATSDSYKNASNQQKIEIRLNLVAQYAAVNDYQKMSNELNSISNDIPEAKNNINYLMYKFIANYGLQKQEDAIASAKAVKATGKPLPAQFAHWKELVDQYAAK